nr:MAG TPA: hypothetical protein [Caudoviricetes sp.]
MLGSIYHGHDRMPPVPWRRGKTAHPIERRFLWRILFH